MDSSDSFRLKMIIFFRFYFLYIIRLHHDFTRLVKAGLPDYPLNREVEVLPSLDRLKETNGVKLLRV